ncbi:molybdenum cofactor biosynthesis protein [Thermococcus sp. 101 C5]|jgi:molybdenum cofactor biosynthesis protein B|uniref:MogA/MoaB family molybdenum cofactor biosynthesis protein n=1 Tax=Thermococcus TaxID=2263 RepID=UPI0005B294AD|nr:MULTISPECIES: MogA/MoaB family molybdenum cofactor biosynthesis protein [Thermococcus]MCA6214509.1 MogA/MoaB family molybdenum cofactor biosynthesis protein [Thermococcus bergensis]MDK2853213.1 molybdopterin adenylyltransferase [Thermococcaceae archaeon]MDK2982750.1 molybdopterin adenylyltransferase [Thermococcaceae archaeon]MPW39552.1 molybdenum cofactor biosynthesis protein [Thermococcus sp. 101 C5]
MGVEEHKAKAPKKFKFAVITVSDTASRGKREDLSGYYIIEELKKEGNENVYYAVVPDEKLKIIKAVIEALEKADVVITTGGTGITRRDVTIEALRPLFDKELVGFGEIFRLKSYEEVGTAAVLSRATAGIIRDKESKVVFCLPGSLNAVKTALEIIKKEAYHILKHARE